jgi:indole-3-glycerol phosphate synthase
MSILDDIVAHKHEEVAAAKVAVPAGEIKQRALRQAPARAFREALLAAPFGLIAEIKKASPSRGILSKEFDHRKIALEYAEGGSHAISVLTDQQFFQGQIPCSKCRAKGKPS